MPGKKSTKKVIIIAFLTSAFIEASQYIFALGECEIDDVISNTLGAWLGVYLFKRIKKFRKNRRESC